MTKYMTLIPAAGRIVPQENGMPWPSTDGRPQALDVSVTRYIRRRLADGDLIAAPATAPQVQAQVQALAPAEPDNSDTINRRRK
jgi:hypothetical protein